MADLGAGPGHVARHLRQLGLPTVAVDLAPAMAAVARQRNGVPAAAGSLTALPLASSSIAAAVVLFAWIHLTDDELAVAADELHRVLRPGGVAVISFHVGDEVVHLDEWHGQAVDLDFRFLRPAAVTAVLDAAGLHRRGVAGARRHPRPRGADAPLLPRRPPAPLSATRRGGGGPGAGSDIPVRCDWAERPPSTTSAWPVIHDASSEHSHTAAAAMSSGRPMRPSGWALSARSRAPSPASMRPTGGVSMAPGQMQLTRICWRA